MTTTSTPISPFTSPSSYLTDEEVHLLKQYAHRDALSNRPSHDLPVRLGIDSSNTFESLQRDIAALLVYYLARRLSFSIEQDLVNYSLTLSRRVTVPGIIAVWLDILKAEVCAMTGNEYESLCSQARNRFTAVTECTTFSAYAARYTLKGDDNLASFEHWFKRFDAEPETDLEDDEPTPQPKPLYTFRHKQRVQKEQRAAGRGKRQRKD